MSQIATNTGNLSKEQQEIPEYIEEVKKLVEDKRALPLKDLFMQIRKKYPEVESMRNLKDNIELYIDGFSVNNNNLVISKKEIFNDIINIIIK